MLQIWHVRLPALKTSLINVAEAESAGAAPAVAFLQQRRNRRIAAIGLPRDDCAAMPADGEVAEWSKAPAC